MTRHSKAVGILSLAGTALLSGAALAADGVAYSPPYVHIFSPSQGHAAQSYANPLAAPAAATTSRAELAPAGVVPGTDAGAPTSTSPRAFGSFGIPYSTERVQHGATTLQSNVGQRFLSSTFPYRTVGALLFNIGANNFQCTASVIRTGVIVTAAHCIQNFGGGGVFFTNHQFSPAYFGIGANAAQQAPYGTFTARTIVISSTWSNGTDPGSGAARANDLAVIALNKNGGGQLVGQVVGQMGYGFNNFSFVSSARTGNLSVADTSTLGYPVLMDNGKILQRTNGPTYLTTISTAPLMMQGNNFTGGSSGGPWVVNFRAASANLSGGAVPGTQSDLKVIGVTSFGTDDPNAPKDNYSSRFGVNSVFPNNKYGTFGAGNIGFLLNFLCSQQTGLAPNPTQTYKAAGWCG